MAPVRTVTAPAAWLVAPVGPHRVRRAYRGSGGDPRLCLEPSTPRTVRVVPGGPVLVEGPVEVVLPDGTRERSDRFVVAVCTCRRSHRYPWCDTSHRRVRRGQGVTGRRRARPHGGRGCGAPHGRACRDRRSGRCRPSHQRRAGRLGAAVGGDRSDDPGLDHVEYCPPTGDVEVGACGPERSSRRWRWWCWA
ncbi:MAG TPA: CDGSH iron-sulfur domain-containing protein [Actinocatenispora sp.]